MIPPPIILSDGPPPERHAARVVSDMCRWLAGQEHQLRSDLGRALALQMQHGLGNPKSQARFERKLKGSPAAKLLLGFGIKKGTRGRCGLRMLAWTLLAPGGAELPEGAPPPEKPWLAALYEEIWPRDPSRDRHAYVCMLTHHAMQRLAERCKARTIDDLLDALRDIANGMFDLGREVQEVDDVLRIPIPTGVAIVEHVDKLGWLVKTVLPLNEETPCPTV